MNDKPVAELELEKSSAEFKKRILLVDDDSSVRNSIGAVLMQAGYEVLQASDGDDALATYDPQQLDLVLLDLGLPKKAGWDTFEVFTGRNPMLPVIVITGQSHQTEMAMLAGAGALMEKPLDVEELFKTIHELLTEPAEARLRRVAGPSQDGRYVSRYIPAKK